MSTTWRHLTTQLDNEWVTLAADTPASTLERWGRNHPHLADLTTLDDIQARIDGNPGDYATRDGILLALIHLTQDGHQLAGRVLIHLLRRGLTRLVTTLPSSLDRTGPEPGEQILGTLWEIIATYPTATRPSRVAANMLMDTRKALIVGNRARVSSPGILSPAARTEIPAADTTQWQETTSSSAEDAYFNPDPGDPTQQLAALLTWATTNRIVTPDDARFLTDLCANPAPGTHYAYNTAAARHRHTYPAARKRASRLLNRIRDAHPQRALAAA